MTKMKLKHAIEITWRDYISSVDIVAIYSNWLSETRGTEQGGQERRLPPTFAIIIIIVSLSTNIMSR